MSPSAKVGEVREREHGVGGVLLAAEDVIALDRDVLPCLGVNDEHAARPDDDHVHLGAPATRPAAVRE